MFWKIIYNLLLVQLGRLYYYEQIFFNNKVFESFKHRQETLNKLAKIKGTCKNAGKIILIHSSSVGEFEQARPIIALIKKKDKDTRVVCSFFSPSGYNFAKKIKNEIDGVVLLPLDTYPRMKRFLNILKPDIIFFMRYDLWPNLIWLAKNADIKMFILNGTIRENSMRGNNKSKILRSFFRSFHKHIDRVFVISEADKIRYSTIIDSRKIIVAGDTRYDIVYQKAQNAKFNEQIFKTFETEKDKYKIFIAGSSYIDEDKILLPAVKKLQLKFPEFKYIVVPHELQPERIEALKTICYQYDLSFCCESETPTAEDYLKNDVIIYDKIGVLYKIYKLADVVFIGGSFHGSIHNIMEPAVYSKLIVFGPTHRNAYEALLFKEKCAALCFNNSKELENIIADFFENENSEFRAFPNQAMNIVKQNLGCSEKIFKSIFN